MFEKAIIYISDFIFSFTLTIVLALIWIGIFAFNEKSFPLWLKMKSRAFFG